MCPILFWITETLEPFQGHSAKFALALVAFLPSLGVKKGEGRDAAVTRTLPTVQCTRHKYCSTGKEGRHSWVCWFFFLASPKSLSCVMISSLG